MQDKVLRNRHLYGEKIKVSKLTNKQVIKIKKEIKKGLKKYNKIPAKELAQRYKVCEATIYNIEAGTTWKHIK
jgi:uncharacterized FlgJ-related protein